MKKVLSTLLALCLLLSFSAPTFAASVVPTNTATLTFQYPNGGGALEGVTIMIEGKEYITNAKGQITTAPLPYGHYVPQIKISSGDDGKSFPWVYTLLSQKVSIGAHSNLPPMQFLNNFYVYRKFDLTAIVLNSENEPVRNMQIEVHKNGKLLFRSTVTTCIAGVLVFDWQELPASVSDPNLALYLGDELVVKGVYRGNEGYQPVEKKIRLSTTQSENFVKLVSHKAGETPATVIPKLFETVLMPEVDAKNQPVDGKGKVDLVYDLGMSAMNTNDMPATLDKSMFTLSAADGSPVPIEEATLNYNHVYLLYDKATYTPAKVSYTALDGKHLVSSTDDGAKVRNFADVAVEASFDANTDAFYKAYEEEVVRLVNEERGRVGVPALSVDEDLMHMARVKSQDMAFNGYLAHDGLTYGYWHEQNKKFGLYDYYLSGENIASMPLSKPSSSTPITPIEAANAVFNGWKNSPAHYSNMKNPEYTRTGVGFSYSGGFYTQVFASTKADRDNRVPVSVTVAKGHSHMGKVAVRTTGIKGTQMTLTATPHETFAFKGWYTPTSALVSTEATYKTTIPQDTGTDGVGYVAQFQPAAFHYTAAAKTLEYINGVPTWTSDVGGTVTGEGDYFLGNSVTFLATENPGFNFYGWYFGGITLPTAANGKLPPVNAKKPNWEMKAGADTQVTALFIKKEPTATLKIEIPAGYSAVYGTEKADETAKFLTQIGAREDSGSAIGVSGGAFDGTGITFTLTEQIPQVEVGFIVNLKSYDAVNHRFLYWMDKDTGEILDNVNIPGYYSNSGYVKLSKDMALVPVFGKPRYTVTSPTGNPGGIVTGRGVFEQGSDVTVTAISNKGYQFKNWSDLTTTDAAYSNPKRTITNLSDKTTVTPVFEPVPQATVTIATVPAELGTIGTVTGGGAGGVGTVQTLIATVKNSEYQFVGWYDGGTLLSKMPTYAHRLVSDVTITAKYEKIQAPYTLTVNAAGGAVAGNETPQYFYGADATLTAHPDAGYQFVGWYENGRDLGTDLTLSKTITASATIEARFAPEESFTVIFRDIDGRIITMQTVAESGKATPPSPSRVGYDFVGWNVNSANLNKVTANYDVVAQYQRSATYEITLTNATVVTPQLGGYYFGNVVTVTGDDKLTVEAGGTMKTGLVFSHWERGGVMVSCEKDYTFMVDGDVALTAVYTTEANAAVPAPLIAMGGAPVRKDGKLSFNAQISVGSDFTLVECGVVLSQTAHEAEGEHALTMETPNSIKAKSTMQSATGQFIITKVDAGAGSWFGRGYLVYADNAGNRYTIYSDNVVGQ